MTDLEGNTIGLIEVLPWHFPLYRLRKTTKTSVKFSVRAEIRSKSLPNTNLCYPTLLGIPAGDGDVKQGQASDMRS